MATRRSAAVPPQLSPVAEVFEAVSYLLGRDFGENAQKTAEGPVGVSSNPDQNTSMLSILFHDFIVDSGEIALVVGENGGTIAGFNDYLELLRGGA